MIVLFPLRGIAVKNPPRLIAGEEHARAAIAAFLIQSV